MAVENKMFLQESMNNDMLQALLVASQQQQYFDIQQFQGMYTQQNIRQYLFELALLVFIKKLCRATHAFVTLTTLSTFAIIGLRNILNLDAIIPNAFSITLLALDNL